MRKFAKVTLIDQNQVKNEKDIIGPDPIHSNVTPTLLQSQMSKTTRPIKVALMDPKLLAGVGNIYSDEALYNANIHPLRKPDSINKDEWKLLTSSVQSVLKKGIDFGGDSMSDYRRLDGTPGKFQGKHQAYRRTGEVCLRKECNGKIERLKIGGRSAHFCNVHQL